MTVNYLLFSGSNCSSEKTKVKLLPVYLVRPFRVLYIFFYPIISVVTLFCIYYIIFGLLILYLQ